MIWVRRKRKCFSKHGWTGKSSLIRLNKSTRGRRKPARDRCLCFRGHRPMERDHSLNKILECRGRAERPAFLIYGKRGRRPLSTMRERTNHDHDQTGDCHARGCGAGRHAPDGASQEAQAHQAHRLDDADRQLWTVGSTDDAIRNRNLRGVRNLCRNGHRSVRGLVQLAFGRRDQRGAYLEQY
jgi:hypothetical protein